MKFCTKIYQIVLYNRFIPPGDGVIEMKDNIVYLKSAANLGLPEVKDHIYEELPSDYANMTSMAVLENEQDLDDSSVLKDKPQLTRVLWNTYPVRCCCCMKMYVRSEED